MTLRETTLSGTTELLTLRHTATADDAAAGATTQCVTATTTEWVAESFASSSSSYSVSTPSTNCTSKHHRPKPTSTTCTGSGGGGGETLSFSEYPSASISSAMKTYLSASPTAITIPIQSGETVIVKDRTTTYTVIDGVSQTAAASFVPEASSTTTTYSGGGFTNSSVSWTGYPSSSVTESVIDPDIVTFSATATTMGYSTTVSGDPDGYITAWLWTVDTGATATESVPPWVTTGLEGRGEEGCICFNLGYCRCRAKEEEDEEGSLESE